MFCFIKKYYIYFIVDCDCLLSWLNLRLKILKIVFNKIEIVCFLKGWFEIGFKLK